MRALSWKPALGAVEWVDAPDPVLGGDDQVLLRMIRGGVCGTDREIVELGRGILPAGVDSMLIGHETYAEVVEVGSEVEGLAAGLRAAIMPRRPCAACEPCRRDRADLCASGEYRETGIVRLDGMFSEYVAAPARYVVPIPAEADAVGVLLEPAAVVEKAWRRAELARGALFETEKSNKALVLGAGPLAILAALFGRLRGGEVWSVSLEAADSNPAKILHEAGVKYARVGELEASDFDTLIDCTGAATAVFDQLHRAARNAVIILAGGGAHGLRCEIDVGSFQFDSVLKNLVWLGTVNADRDSWRRASENLARLEGEAPGLLARMITRRLGRSEAPAAFGPRRDGEIKTVIDFSA